MTTTHFPHALVTGASSGLGRALVLELARRGSVVHLVARRVDELERLAGEVRAARGHAHVWPADVTDRAALAAALVAAEEAAGGALDLVVAGAGVAENALGERATWETSSAVVDLDLAAAIETLERSLPAMRARGNGTLAAISSLAGVRALPGAASYCAAKAGLIAWLEAKSMELAGTGVRVVDLRPGFVRTAMTDRNDFRMPVLLGCEDAARRMADGLAAGKRVVQFPRRLAWPLAAAARFAPHPLWRLLLRR